MTAPSLCAFAAASPARAGRQCLRTAWAHWLGAALLGWAVPVAAVLAQPVTTLVLAGDVDPDALGSRWATRAYAEAARRMGIRIEIRNYPIARRASELDRGNIDGDSGRVWQYGDEHPNLIRIDAPFSELVFALYTADPAVRVQSLDDLRGSGWMVEYRRGVLFCERALKSVVPADQVADLSSEDQGLKKLLAGRISLYCDVEYAVRSILNTPEFRDKTQLRKAFTLGSVPIYPYLHRKHAQLAPRLTATLQAMLSEGLIEAYRVQLEKEMGWTR